MRRASRFPLRRQGVVLEAFARAEGEARMVEVSTKAPTLRRARAAGFVRMALATRRLIEAGEGPVMVKAADPRMSIEGIRLLENTRGRSGVGG